MAAEIEEVTQIQAKLIKGGSGVFDVRVDGRLIYSKSETGRFPEHEEVLKKLH
ncbi:MAG: hypothetical protein CL917_18995 [Deltaproteobacteria bacterium]|nr:hypothetical protein [Deltaproteobacteria bacterium]